MNTIQSSYFSLLNTKKGFQLLIITILFSNIPNVYSQDKKLLNHFIIWPNQVDTVYKYYYHYDENNNLQRIDEFYDNLSWSYFFSNDSLKLEAFVINGGDTSFTSYQYYSDSIISLSYLNNNDTIRGIYLLNDSKKIISFEDGYSSYSYIWENENCIFYSRNSNVFTYSYQSWINPFYEENKNFRLGTKGSFEYNEYTYYGGYVYRNTVIEGLDNYPIHVERYENDELLFLLYFNYRDFTNIDESINNESEIIKVEYFDIMGRKITKPKDGFYIEKKTTTSGISTEKFYRSKI